MEQEQEKETIYAITRLDTAYGQADAIICNSSGKWLACRVEPQQVPVGPVGANGNHLAPVVIPLRDDHKDCIPAPINWESLKQFELTDYISAATN